MNLQLCYATACVEERKMPEAGHLCIVLTGIIDLIHMIVKEEKDGYKMKHNEIVEMLEETGIPIAYEHFPEDDSPDPPFICFQFTGSDSNATESRINPKPSRINVELYTSSMGSKAAQILQAVLDSHSIIYSSSETAIETEKRHVTLYQFEANTNDAL